MANLIFSALTLLGIGGIVGGYVTYLLNRRKELDFKQLEHKEKRYKSCLLFMDVYFEPKNIKYLSSRHIDIHTAHDVMEYLRAEYHEMLLYGSKEVVLAVKVFIEKPTRENFLNTILRMREDLWTKRTDFTISEISIAGMSSEK